MRDDFSQATKDLLANRVGWKCSNPNCRKATRGAGAEKTDIINIGIGADGVDDVVALVVLHAIVGHVVGNPPCVGGDIGSSNAPHGPQGFGSQLAVGNLELGLSPDEGG